MTIPQEIIAIKRDGGALTRAEIEAFVAGVVSGDFQDHQTSALLMAIFLNGMSDEETAWLTEAMMNSGRVIKLPEISRPKIDKHSTGGVGDKVSLILAPLAASVGLCVPMMSGRGLGHTGGTLDKLEAIPGFRVDLTDAEYRSQLKGIHQAMIGQSSDIVPADKKLYALRDVTGTVESVPLICSSILSKKMAEGIDGLVLDVKCGLGAFMKTEADARALAKALTRISSGVGKPTTALLTRMDEPLGFAVGNALEVIEAIECLKGRGPDDLMQVTLALTAEMVLLSGLETSSDAVMKRLLGSIESGDALKAFVHLVEAQGGNADVIENYDLFQQPAFTYELYCGLEKPTYLSALDAGKVGESARMLGAGRAHSNDKIDPAAGIYFYKKVGDLVSPGDLVCRLHYEDSKRLERGLDRLKSAITYSAEKPQNSDIIIDRIVAT